MASLKDATLKRYMYNQNNTRQNMYVGNHNRIMQDITRITTDANHELFEIQCTAKLCEQYYRPKFRLDNCGVVPQHVAVSL